MIMVIINLIFTMDLFVSDVSESVLITQWPQYIFSLPNTKAEIHCYQNDTDYEYLYWYKQRGGKDIQLMASIVGRTVNMEEGFKSGFQATKVTTEHWSLTVAEVQRGDEAVYLCAACLHSATADLRSVTKTYSVERD